mgnify:CR=1 FL=1
MSMYSSKDIKIEVMEKGGTTPTDISKYITEPTMLHAEADTEEIHGFGEEWVRHGAVGTKRVPELTLKGWYEDTVDTGVVAIRDNEGSEVEIHETIGETGTTYKVTAIVKKFQPLPALNEFLKFECTLMPTSGIEEVTV